MIREPITAATRRLASPSRLTVLPNSPTKKPRSPPITLEKRANDYSTSKVLAALDAAELNDKDEDIEIFGPLTNATERNAKKETKGRKTELKVEGLGGNKAHPFFIRVGDVRSISGSTQTTSTAKSRTRTLRVNSHGKPILSKANFLSLELNTRKNGINLGTEIAIEVADMVQLDTRGCSRNISGSTVMLSKGGRGLKELDPECVPAPHSVTISRSAKEATTQSFPPKLPPTTSGRTTTVALEGATKYVDVYTDALEAMSEPPKTWRNEHKMKGHVDLFYEPLGEPCGPLAVRSKAKDIERVKTTVKERLTKLASASATETLQDELPLVVEEAEGKIEAEHPVYSYKDYLPSPMVVYTRHEEEADDLIGSLKQGPVALDMEWRVLFTRTGARSSPSERRTAVIQVADSRGLVLVMQVFGMGRFPKKLQELIEDAGTPKVGVNILNDGLKLFRDYGILSRNLVELGALAQVADPEKSFGRKRKIISLAKLVDAYCAKTLMKGDERTGNWEAELDEKQLEYAVNDVHSSLEVYKILAKKAKENGKDIGSTKAVDFYTSDLQAPGNIVLSGVNPLQAQEATEMRSQYMRAYRMWYEQQMSIEKMCVELSLKGKGYGPAGATEGGLKVGTVITYVISALQANAALPYDTEKLRELVQMDLGSWMRHREWFIRIWNATSVQRNEEL